MSPVTIGDSIVREINTKAPAERIFEALTNSSELLNWWGAKGKFQAPHVECDLRPGGRWKMPKRFLTARWTGRFSC